VIESRPHDEWGRALHLRRAEDEAERAALHREATMLGLARHPGVVEVVRADPAGGELVGELVLAAPCHRTFRGLEAGADDALAVLAAACETLADLHALGLVHGAIGPDAILVEPGRAPVLTGFGRAGLAGEPATDGRVRRPGDDVVALAELVRSHREGAWSRRRPRRPAPGARRGHDPDELDHLLRDAAEGHPPPARRLAWALAHAVSGPRPPGETSPDPFARLRPVEVEPEARRGPRVLTLAAGVAGVAALTAGALGLGLGSAPARRPGLAASSSGPATTPNRPGPVGVTTARGGVLVVGPTRYRIGVPGDEALAADWGCRGTTRAVVLRPATGELFVFRGWAQPGHDLVAAPAGRVAPGSHLRAGADHAGCAELWSAAPGGRRQPVALAST